MRKKLYILIINILSFIVYAEYFLYFFTDYFLESVYHKMFCNR